QFRSAYRDRTSMHVSPTRLVVVENTHNSSGGRVWPLEEIEAMAATCRELDMRIHLDGARLMNAAVATATPAAEIGRRFDTVTLCLSKALGCPLGALVAGSAELMAKARRGKHLFGGAMRQAGIVAAAGLYALDHNVERLAEDHENARALAEGIAELPGARIDPSKVETNIVIFEVDDAPRVKGELASRGVEVTVFGPGRIRAVTHLDVDRAGIDRALAVLGELL